jgi:hypothetical protein
MNRFLNKIVFSFAALLSLVMAPFSTEAKGTDEEASIPLFADVDFKFPAPTVKLYHTPLGVLRLDRGFETCTGCEMSPSYARLYLGKTLLAEVMGPDIRSITSVGRRVFVVGTHEVAELKGKKLETVLDLPENMVGDCKGNFCSLLDQIGSGSFKGVISFDTKTGSWVKVDYESPFEHDYIERIKRVGRTYRLHYDVSKYVVSFDPSTAKFTFIFQSPPPPKNAEIEMLP